MLGDGRLLRVRAGWYASPETPPDVISAVRAGGSVTCGTALRMRRVWTVAGPTHYRIPPHGHLRGRPGIVHHLSGRAVDGVDDLASALGCAARCLPRDHLVCAIDSALHQQLISPSQLHIALDSTRGRRMLALVDGRAESGLETLARLRLRGRGLRVRAQVRIAGVGRVDLVVGDRLVIELDGDEWHSTAQQREHDRRRDAALVALGYLVMRAGYHRVMADWEWFEREVLAVVRRREHRWRAVHRRGQCTDADERAR